MDREGPKQTQSITTIQSTQNIVIVIILIKAIWISAKTQMLVAVSNICEACQLQPRLILDFIRTGHAV